jgi:hypothetical protein
MGAEEDTPVQHRLSVNELLNLRLLSGVGAPVPGGRPNAEPGDGRASGAVRRRLDLRNGSIRQPSWQAGECLLFRIGGRLLEGSFHAWGLAAASLVRAGLSAV